MSLKDRLNVMVVDDMSVSRGLLAQAVEEIGVWRVRAEASGSSAIASLAAEPAHLVLADFYMPEMDGLQLLEGLRRNPATERIGFILVTGTPTEEIADRGRHLGLNNLMAKPFTRAVLKTSIEAVVGRL